MKKLTLIITAVALIAAALSTSGHAQTRTVSFVTNAYDLKVQQFAAGTLGGSSYAAFGGEAKAVNNKIAADLKTFAFTVLYSVDASGVATITGGTFLIQTTNKDRSPLIVGGEIAPGTTMALRVDGVVAPQKLSLSLTGSAGTDISGVITATVDKSDQPKLSGALTLTYPVVQ
jgi:hypothetical protein